MLTIYTAKKVPDIVDLQTLQNLPEKLSKIDLHKLPADLLPCIPSLPNMPDLHKLRENLLQLLSNCLPDRFSHGNHTDVGVLVLFPPLCYTNYCLESLLFELKH